jgi:hypothetical protein
MAHFAKVENGVVTQVIVAGQGFIDSGFVGDPKDWVQTSFNTRGGVHYGQDGQPDGGVALRKNFACVGYTYDPALDAFYAPSPYPSWLLNKDTALWEPPIPKPADFNDYPEIEKYPSCPLPGDYKDYIWNEETLSWVELGW